ncbi:MULTISPECIES: Mov34/MPN/PAD-1 family protein [unclassified Sphingopyxis]|uniref:Mov34/MPN/PAD-1 family protein n=1 Tax=unclassified Sphingopyxis TaxID=2614943 RepID=UPI0018D20A2D|nr:MULTISPECIES: Mov34/MPN/PAD-1 family protein [unclassified Sphingopyxis]
MPGVPAVAFTPRCRATLCRLAEAPSGRERCGLLIGVREAARLSVGGAIALPNRSAAPAARFLLRGADIAAAMARADGELLGYFHTHLWGGNDPSAADIWSMRRRPGLHAILDSRARARLFWSTGGRLSPPPLA